jgi:hypothetical protein
VRAWKAHEGEHVVLCIVDKRGELGQLGSEVIGDDSPLFVSRFGRFVQRRR